MKKINFIIFTIIYFAASIVLLGNPYRPLTPELIYTRYIVIFVLFSGLIFIYFKKNGLTLFRFPSFLSIYLFIIWFLFSLTMALSEIIHQSFPVQGLFFLLVVPFIYFTVMPFMTKKGGAVIYQSLFAANFLYLVISFLTKPIDFLPYTGVAANPNGFGQMAAIAFFAGFFTLITLTKKGKLLRLLLIAAMIVSLGSVLLSSSRTSLLVVGMVTLLILIHFMFTRGTFKPFLIILVLGLIGWFSPLKDMFISGIMEKFSTTYIEGNLLSGRMGVWKLVVSESSLFGNGRDYFNKFFEGAHNSIIYILGVYGIVPALLLTVFLLLLIVLSFRYAVLRRKDHSAVFPFIIIVTFTLFSLTEAMFGLIGNGITIAFFHVAGLLIFKEKMRKSTNVAFNT
jgi:O-antigen ligase